MRLPDHLIECVGFLCERRASGGATKFQPVATAFFMSVQSKTIKNAQYNYLITARHCVNERLYLRLNTRKGGYEYIELRDEWLFHADPNVDVGVLPFAPDTSLFEYKTADASMLATEAKTAEHLIGIGEEVAIPGLFVNRIGNERNIPIVRFGNLAAMPVEKIVGSQSGQAFHAYLVEVRSIGGLSGSPVFAYLGPSRVSERGLDLGHYYLFLLGVVRGHWHFDKDRSEINALADDAKSVNMGIALVTPATELETIIYGDYLIKGRATKDQELLVESAAAIKEDSSPLSS